MIAGIAGKQLLNRQYMRDDALNDDLKIIDDLNHVGRLVEMRVTSFLRDGRRAKTAISTVVTLSYPYEKEKTDQVARTIRVNVLLCYLLWCAQRIRKVVALLDILK